MTDKILVTIVVPCYNQGVYLSEALDSILHQTYKDWECIIVNDGSTDDTETVSAVYIQRDDRFRYIRQDNRGLSAARNVGIRNGKGRYIFPLDADDKIGYDYIKDAVRILEKEPSVKIVYCEAEFFGEKTGKWELPDFSIERLMVENLIFCSALFRRSDYEVCGGYDETMEAGWEDWELWISILTKGGTAYKIQETMFFYRIKSSSMISTLSKSGTQQRDIRLYVFKKHAALYDKYTLPVSIIIPNYNHAAYLPKRIESVLNQNFPFFEVILMDDCSMDNSREIIDYYATQDKRVRVIYNDKNSGSTFKQWNKGIKQARGRYIWFAESDDYADVNFLATLFQTLELHKSAGIAFCQSNFVDEKDNIIGKWDYDPHGDTEKWKNNFMESGTAMIGHYFAYINIIPNASAALFRKEAILKSGFADESYRLIGDLLFYTNILFESDLIYMARPLNFFRMHTLSVRNKSEKNGLFLIEMARYYEYLFRSSERLGAETLDKQKVIENFINVWMHKTMQSPQKFSAHAKIYTILSALCPDLNRFLVKEFKSKRTKKKAVVENLLLGLLK